MHDTDTTDWLGRTALAIWRMGRDVPRLPYGIHNHPQEKINPTTYLSNFLGCYMIFLVCVLLFKEGYYMASWPGWTALDIWRAGRDEPRLPYGELAKADHARHMASWPGRGSSPSSTYGEPVGLGQTSAFLGWFGRFGSVGKPFSRFVICFPRVFCQRDWIF